MYIALLHGEPAIFEAANKNLATGQYHYAMLQCISLSRQFACGSGSSSSLLIPAVQSCDNRHHGL